MNKLKRKSFFLKGNFQIVFIIGFISILLFEVTLAGFFIYKLSAETLEEAVFSSHINIATSAQIIKPIIIRINIYVILISVALACLIITVTYIKLRVLFGKIIDGLENLKNNNTPLHIKPYGRKQARELIKEFNLAASCLDKQLAGLHHTIDSLVKEKELRHIAKSHDKLYSIIAGNNRE